MEKLKLYALLWSVLSWNGCRGAVTEDPPSGLYSDTLSSSSDAENKEETNQKRGPSGADVLILPEDTLTWPITPPGVPVPKPDASKTTDIFMPKETYLDSGFSSEDGSFPPPPETDTLTPKNIDTVINAALDTTLESGGVNLDNYNGEDIYNSGETGLDSYLFPETEGDFGDEDSEEAVNYPDSLGDLVKDEEECYSIAKEEFLSYSIESAESPGELEMYLMVGKYSGENNCLALYDESGEAYPEICTYLYAYFFSDQPFGYFHCSGSENIGVGESLPDYCYYEVKLPATPKEIKDTATEAVWCTYNSLGWN